MRFSHLADWLRWQESLHPSQIDLGLERVRAVFERLGSPSPAPIVIIVAGTNGKGSSVAMLDAIYRSAGYKVGTYTSPHLFRYNERICVGGISVEDQVLCQAFARVDEAREDVSLTYFEFGTLAAINILSTAQLDVAILEVGLGGRLDAVNVLDANVALITSIDLDHTAWLGNDRESIGREKAGIFRAGRPAVCGDSAPPQTVVSAAENLNASLYCFKQEFDYSSNMAGWTWRSQNAQRTALPHPVLRGAFQLQNASAVLMVTDLLHSQLPISQNDIRKGLAEATIPGRFQIISEPLTQIFDVAHNPHAAHALAANLRAFRGKGKTHAVFSILRDKDIPGVISALCSVIDVWHVGGLQMDRGCTSREIADVLNSIIANPGALTNHDSVLDAYRHALSVTDSSDRLVVFGSFYTVAEILIQLQ